MPSFFDLIADRPPHLDPRQYSRKIGGYGAETVYALDTPVEIGDLDVNESDMSLYLPLAAGGSRDSVGDRCHVESISTERHYLNPIIGFDHMKEYARPIGRARKDPKDPATYSWSVDVLKQKAGARTWFYQGLNSCGLTGDCPPASHGYFTAELFDMCARAGMLSAGSIGYIVQQAERLPEDYYQSVPAGLDLQRILLIEGSLVVTPCNQSVVAKSSKSLTGFEYIAKALTGGRINGRQPTEDFRRIFSKYLPARPATVRGGFDPATQVLRTKYGAKALSATAETTGGAVIKPAGSCGKDCKCGGQCGGKQMERYGVPVGNGYKNIKDTAVTPEPYGAQTIRLLQDDLVLSHKRYRSFLKQLEDEDTRILVEGWLDTIERQLDAVSNTWKGHPRYKYFGPLYWQVKRREQAHRKDMAEAGTKAVMSKVPDRFHDYHPMPVGSTVTSRKPINHYDAGTGKWTFEVPAGERMEVIGHDQATGGVRVRTRTGQEATLGRHEVRGRTTGRGHKIPNPSGQEEPYQRESQALTGSCQRGQTQAQTGCQPSGDKSLWLNKLLKRMKDAEEYLLDVSGEKHPTDPSMDPADPAQVNRGAQSFDFEKQAPAYALGRTIDELAADLPEDHPAKYVLASTSRLLNGLATTRVKMLGNLPLDSEERQACADAAKALGDARQELEAEAELDGEEMGAAEEEKAGHWHMSLDMPESPHPDEDDCASVEGAGQLCGVQTKALDRLAVSSRQQAEMLDRMTKSLMALVEGGIADSAAPFRG
jgi:hypothetical protein